MQLLEEVDREVGEFSRAKALDDIKLETLNSLISRLQTKKTQLGKKANKRSSGDTVNNIDAVSKRKAQLVAITDFVKALLTAEKKRERKKAQAVQKKVHALKNSGIGMK